MARDIDKLPALTADETGFCVSFRNPFRFFVPKRHNGGMAMTVVFFPV
jgi:hypothetical protein